MPGPMSFDAANEYLNRRLHAVTALGSKAISADVPARVRANVFFSARVADDHIAARLRAVSDEFSAGRINLAEARTRLKAFLADEGYAPGGVGSPPDGVDPERWREAQKLTNLASTARLNLILRQNAAQAQAVGHWQVGQDADIKRRWPCWRYIALPGARDSHAALNNKVFRKDDPIWHRIFPPWEFNCRCQVEDCDEEEAETYGGVSVAASYPDAPASGYEFDPSQAFGNLDLSRIESPRLRTETRLMIESEFGDQVTRSGNMLKVTPNEHYKTYEELGLAPASSWPRQPRQAPLNPENARAQLAAGIKVLAADGTPVVFDNGIIKHWTEDYEPSTPEKDINGRLARLGDAVATVEHPAEMWRQATQKIYLAAFGGSRRSAGVLVAVKGDGSVRSYILKSDRQLDAARRGLKRIK